MALGPRPQLLAQWVGSTYLFSGHAGPLAISQLQGWGTWIAEWRPYSRLLQTFGSASRRSELGHGHEWRRGREKARPTFPRYICEAPFLPSPASRTIPLATHTPPLSGAGIAALPAARQQQHELLQETDGGGSVQKAKSAPFPLECLQHACVMQGYKCTGRGCVCAMYVILSRCGPGCMTPGCRASYTSAMHLCAGVLASPHSKATASSPGRKDCWQVAAVCSVSPSRRPCLGLYAFSPLCQCQPPSVARQPLAPVPSRSPLCNLACIPSPVVRSVQGE